MKTTGTARTWTLATVLISVIIVLAAWFLLVSPVLAEASDTNAEAQAQEEANDLERVAVDKLRVQYEDIDLYEAELAALQEQITTTQRYADLQRLVASIAEEHDVVVTSLQFGTAEDLPVVLAAEEDTTQPDPAASAEPDPEATAEAGAAADAGPRSAVQGLYSISVNVSFRGDYNAVLGALSDLQHGDQRIVLITSVSLQAADGDESGDAATELLLGGETFVLADPKASVDGAAPDQTDESAAPAMPELPQSTDNPLTPAGR